MHKERERRNNIRKGKTKRVQRKGKKKGYKENENIKVI